MTKLINELYGGKLHPSSTPIPQDNDYHLHLDEVCKLEKELENELGDKGKKLFQDYNTAQAKVGYLNCEAKFSEGFTLGAKLMIEILNQNDGEHGSEKD